MGKVEIAECHDPYVIEIAQRAVKVLVHETGVKSALVLLASACTSEAHGNHVTMALGSLRGKLDTAEARAVVSRLRSLANELENKFVVGKGN